jgi:hypothetical protein
MSDKNPQSRRLQELLAHIKNSRSRDPNSTSFENYESELDPSRVYNSHVLYQEAATKIVAEQDINLVREIAMYYLNCCCSVMSDHAATMVFEQIEGIS